MLKILSLLTFSLFSFAQIDSIDFNGPRANMRTPQASGYVNICAKAKVILSSDRLVLNNSGSIIYTVELNNKVSSFLNKTVKDNVEAPVCLTGRYFESTGIAHVIKLRLDSVARSSKTKSVFFFAFHIEEGESDEYPYVVITTVKDFQANAGLTDSYSEEEEEILEEFLEAAKICNSMESTYEPCGDFKSIQSWKLNLIKVSKRFSFIQYSKEFQNIINTEW